MGINKKENENYSILIVDDVPKNIQLVAKFLTNEGYLLYFAQSGETALKQIEEKRGLSWNLYRCSKESGWEKLDKDEYLDLYYHEFEATIK